jgi:hypothetical protein
MRSHDNAVTTACCTGDQNAEDSTPLLLLIESCQWKKAAGAALQLQMYDSMACYVTVVKTAQKNGVPVVMHLLYTTMLHLSVRHKIRHIVAEILCSVDQECNVDAQTASGRNAALHLVLRNPAAPPSLIEQLVAYGADVTLRNQDGKSSLDLAFEAAESHALALFGCMNDMHVDAKLQSGKTLLESASVSSKYQANISKSHESTPRIMSMGQS